MSTLIKNNANTASIIAHQELGPFFFSELDIINQSYTPQQPMCLISYCSNIMQNFATSDNFFVHKNDKRYLKMLGIAFLEAQSKSSSEQVRIIKDIGDTALFVCGFLSEAIDNKILNLQYYKNIGISSYTILNSLTPIYFDTQNFYKLLANNFQHLLILLSTLKNKLGGNLDNNFKKILPILDSHGDKIN